MYEINVSKQNSSGNYYHYFATAPRSITNSTELAAVAADFSERFPSPEFHITVSYTPERGRMMTYESFAQNPERLTSNE